MLYQIRGANMATIIEISRYKAISFILHDLLLKVMAESTDAYKANICSRIYFVWSGSAIFWGKARYTRVDFLNHRTSYKFFLQNRLSIFLANYFTAGFRITTSDPYLIFIQFNSNCFNSICNN